MENSSISSSEAVMSLAHRWANATYNKALGKPFEDFDAIQRDMRTLLASHFSHSAVSETGDPNICGPLTDAQRQHARCLLSNLHHLGHDAQYEAIRYAAVSGYTNGRKDFGLAMTTASEAPELS